MVILKSTALGPYLHVKNPFIFGIQQNLIMGIKSYYLCHSRLVRKELQITTTKCRVLNEDVGYLWLTLETCLTHSGTLMASSVTLPFVQPCSLLSLLFFSSGLTTFLYDV